MKAGPINCSSLSNLPRQPADVQPLGQRCNYWRASIRNLPATFFHLFVGALNHWLRVYDHRDAEERAETLREWAAQEPDADQYELPDVEGSIPPCMRQGALDESELAQLKDKINDPLATKLVDAVTSLDRMSRQAERPEIDDDIGQQLSDCNPALPCLLAIFAEVMQFQPRLMKTLKE